MRVRVEFDEQNRPITYVDGERVRAKGDVLDGRVVHATVDGVPVSFERRRYGRATFYCWAFAFIRGEWRALGDPWPCARPKTAELAEAIARHSKP